MKKILLSSCFLFFLSCFSLAQNVGIGTSTPDTSALLHIHLGASTTHGLLVTGAYDPVSTVPDLGAGTRMMFYPGKAAFRAGEVSGNQWDNTNVGNYSFATGSNTIASGNYSTALGFLTTASGSISTALGAITIASGNYSTALGNSSTASGDISTAMGVSTTASGAISTAMGQGTTASGPISTAMGYNTIASASFSTAMGSNTTASGFYSTSMGSNLSAKSGYETVLGRFNTDYTPLSIVSWDPADRLFSIGNGTDPSSRSDALVVLKNGNTGIGTSLPNASALLHIDLGTSTTKGVLITGTYDPVSTVPNIGAGSRMMFYPGKSAFRAGTVNGIQWDNTNVGNYSFATGSNTTASGNYSTAMGQFTTASGYYSTAMGSNTTASGYYSTAMGSNTTASEFSSTAMG